jgi:hypothetical protein
MTFGAMDVGCDLFLSKVVAVAWEKEALMESRMAVATITLERHFNAFITAPLSSLAGFEHHRISYGVWKRKKGSFQVTCHEGGR